MNSNSDLLSLQKERCRTVVSRALWLLMWPSFDSSKKKKLQNSILTCEVPGFGFSAKFGAEPQCRELCSCSLRPGLPVANSAPEEKPEKRLRGMSGAQIWLLRGICCRTVVWRASWVLIGPIFGCHGQCPRREAEKRGPETSVVPRFGFSAKIAAEPWCRELRSCQT